MHMFRNKTPVDRPRSSADAGVASTTKPGLQVGCQGMLPSQVGELIEFRIIISALPLITNLCAIGILCRTLSRFTICLLFKWNSLLLSNPMIAASVKSISCLVTCDWYMSLVRSIPSPAKLHNKRKTLLPHLDDFLMNHHDQWHNLKKQITKWLTCDQCRP